MSTAALACSGEGAAEAMAQNSLLGFACLLISFAATLVAVVRARKRGGTLAKVLAVFAVLLLMAHPTIWLGVTSGDCGHSLRVTGPVVVALHCAIVGPQQVTPSPLKKGIALHFFTSVTNASTDFFASPKSMRVPSR